MSKSFNLKMLFEPSHRFVALVGPRIVPFGQKMKFLLTALDFPDNEIAIITIKGKSDGETSETSVTLKPQQEFSIKVSP